MPGSPGKHRVGWTGMAETGGGGSSWKAWSSSGVSGARRADPVPPILNRTSTTPGVAWSRQRRAMRSGC